VRGVFDGNERNGLFSTVTSGLPVIRSQLGILEASPATVLDECVADEKASGCGYSVQLDPATC
jgi:hypothetical protein